MASRGRGARVKGAQFERDIANWLTEQTSIVFKRGLAQTRGGGAEVADVTPETSKIPVHFECKRHKRPNIASAYEQACEDAKENQLKIVITKADRKDTLVTMNIDDWLILFQAWIKQNGYDS